MLLSEIRQMIDRAIAEHGDMEAVTELDGYATPLMDEIRIETWPGTWTMSHGNARQPTKLAIIRQNMTNGYLKREDDLD